MLSHCAIAGLTRAEHSHCSPGDSAVECRGKGSNLAHHRSAHTTHAHSAWQSPLHVSRTAKKNAKRRQLSKFIAPGSVVTVAAYRAVRDALSRCDCVALDRAFVAAYARVRATDLPWDESAADILGVLDNWEDGTPEPLIELINRFPLSTA